MISRKTRVTGTWIPRPSGHWCQPDGRKISKELSPPLPGSSESVRHSPPLSGFSLPDLTTLIIIPASRFQDFIQPRKGTARIGQFACFVQGPFTSALRLCSSLFSPAQKVCLSAVQPLSHRGMTWIEKIPATFNIYRHETVSDTFTFNRSDKRCIHSTTQHFAGEEWVDEVGMSIEYFQILFTL